MSVLVRLCVCMCTQAYEYVCMCMYTKAYKNVCVCICVHEHMHGAEVSVGCLLLIPTLFFKKEPLVEPRTHQLASLTDQQPLGLSVSTFQY